MRKGREIAGRANHLLQLGRSYISNKKFADALAVYKKLEELLEDLTKLSMCGDKEWAGFLNDKGIALFFNGDFPESVRILESALKIKRKLGNKEFLFSTIMNLAKSYRANCQYVDSLSILNEALELSIKLGNKRLENDVKSEITNTEYAKDKRPLVQFADVRIGTTRDTTFSIADMEYLPSLFNYITARVENVNLAIVNSLEATVAIDFVVLGQDEIRENLYKKDAWKKNKPPMLEPTIEESSPNFVLFYGPKTRIVGKDVRIEDDKGNKLSFDSREQNWNIFLPDSYPIGGFVFPMPICENFMYFFGIARIFYWKLSFRNKYRLQIKIIRNSASDPFQFGLFFPFKRVEIEAPNVTIESDPNLCVKDSYLKRLPYETSRSLDQTAPKFLDFTNCKAIYEFKGDKIHRLHGADLTVLLGARDFEVLCFEVFTSEKKGASKFDLFSFLKNDLDFRREISNDSYVSLLGEIRKMPEKCAAKIDANKCRNCVTEIKNLCVVNLI
ncbi:MAG: tetratricopeptide repeat protein, partial [Candidatus Bathyarchaeota archaeon]|nr:tetratricopeptide repeat protein [Candidatus Bathyarchaeota archaeon]